MRQFLTLPSINGNSFKNLTVENLTVNNSATIGNDLTVSDDTAIGGDLTVSGAIETATGVITGGELNSNGDINATNGTIKAFDLIVANESAFTGVITCTTIVSNTTISGNDLTTLGDTRLSNLSEHITGVRTVTQTATDILETDKVLLLVSTGAGGPFVITPSDLGNGIYKITMIMTAFNTAVFTFTCLQGTVTFGAVGDCASFIWTGSDWSLMGAPQGAMVA